MNRVLIFSLLFVSFASSLFADPRMWDPAGVAIRQGHHIEWQRTTAQDSAGNLLVVWSDTRNGGRQVYAQLINPEGQPLWADGGVLVSRNDSIGHEDAAATSVNGGFILAWIHAWESDELWGYHSDVYAQKLDYSGSRVWPNDLVVDDHPSIVNELSLLLTDDEHGGALIAWEDTRRQDPADIIVQHISASGELWDEALEVTDLPGEQFGATVAGDGIGNMIVCWIDSRSPSDRNLYAAKVTPDRTLPWSINGGLCVCCVEGPQDQVRIAADGTGGAYFIWRDQRNGVSRDLYAQRLNGNGEQLWAEDGILVCSAVEDQTQARIATSYNNGTPDGFVAVWEDLRVNGFINEVYAQKMLANGTAAWAENGVFVCGNAGPGGQGDPREGGRVISDHAGGAFVVWEDVRSDGNWLSSDLYGARLNANGGFIWGDNCGIEIAVDDNLQYAHTLSLDLAGNLRVIFDDTSPGSQRIISAAFSRETGEPIGAPTDVIIVSGLDGDAERPGVHSLAPGTAAVVWQDNRFVGGGTRLYYQVINREAEIQLAEYGQPLVTDLEELPPFQHGHSLCSDGANGCFVAFEDMRSGVPRIRLRRISAEGFLVGPAAGSELYDAPEPQDQTVAYCAPDSSGGCYVAWSGYDAQWLLDVYVMRADANCEPMWEQPVRLIRGDIDDDLIQGVMPSADGTCIVYWQSGALDQYDVSAAQITPDGGVLWDRNVCSAGGAQYQIVAVSDLSGGAYFAWIDQRIQNGEQDIYAQHISSDGHDLWQTNGIPMTRADDLQMKPQIALRSDGNLWVAWEDFRNVNDLDLFLQCVTPAGQLLLPANGLPFCIANLDQTEVRLIAGYNSDLYALWTDGRYPYFTDLYGTHLNSNGLPDYDNYWVENGSPICDVHHVQRRASVASDGTGGIFCFFEDGRASGMEPLIGIYGQYVRDMPDAVEESPLIPTEFKLAQNFPNPFNPVTEISYSIPSHSLVRLAVFDITGRQVAQLINETQTAGQHSVRFDATLYSSGLYFYRLTAGEWSGTRKMVLLK